MHALLKFWLVVSQVLAVAKLLPWLLMASMSMMAFDSGPSLGAYAFVSAMWLYPVVAIGCAITAWLAARRGKALRAGISTTLPLLYLPALLGILHVIERGF